MQALLEQAYRLDRVTAAERQKIYKMMSSRGWRTAEPGTDRLVPQVPELIHAPVEQLREAGLSDDEIAQLTGARDAATAAPFMTARRSLHAVR